TLRLRLSPLSPLFPYTTLFRSPETWSGHWTTWRAPRELARPLKHFRAPRELVQPLDHFVVPRDLVRPPDHLASASRIGPATGPRSEEHTSELQSRENLVCRLLL